MIILYGILALALSGLFITYAVWPVYMLSKLPKKMDVPVEPQEFPHVTVLLAAYNEETFLEKRLRNLFNSNYPSDRLEVLVGSDASTDATDDILARFAAAEPRLRWRRFSERTGKAGILNALLPETTGSVLVFTDANVFFDANCIKALVGPLENPAVGMSGGWITYTSRGKEGIAAEERGFINLENRVKWAESKLWKFCMGVEGGCFALRRELFDGLPGSIAVDDFYLTMTVLEKEYQVIFGPAAHATEDHSPRQSVEFKRKVRISTGNFQNLKRFGKMYADRLFPLGIAFWCHKGLRWYGPHLMLLALLTSLAIGAITSNWLIAVLLWGLLGLSLLDVLPLFNRLPHSPLRSLNHFLVMNLALFLGWLKYMNGHTSHVWAPTERNERTEHD